MFIISIIYLFWLVFSYLHTKQTNKQKLENHIHLVPFFLLFLSGEQSSPVLHSFNWSLESPLKPLQWHSVNISEWCQAGISVIAHKLQIELKLYYFLLQCLMHEFAYLVWLSWWHTIFFLLKASWISVNMV